MHDVFEGIVPYEVSLVLQQLIKDNIFTLDFLNCRISSFQYGSVDARNKPEAQNLHKNTLIGTASQNWTLVRLLPLLIGDIVPKDNLMWIFFLHLKLIIEMLCLKFLPLDMLMYCSLKLRITYVNLKVSIQRISTEA